MISPIEQFLLDKFNAEIGYCNIALLKAGIGAAEELKGLVEIGKSILKSLRKNIGVQLALSGCAYNNMGYPDEDVPLCWLKKKLEE